RRLIDGDTASSPMSTSRCRPIMRLDRSLFWIASASCRVPFSTARSGDVSMASQSCGEGAVDLVFVMGWVSHLEYFWKEPSFARFLGRLASFSRLILFDKRGTGLSDPVTQLPTPAQGV